MTDAEDRRIEERLHGLAHRVSVPTVPAQDDVRRGRRRLIRLRLAVAGGVAGTLAIVAGGAAVSAGVLTAEPTLGPADPSSPRPSSSMASPDATPGASPSAEPDGGAGPGAGGSPLTPGADATTAVSRGGATHGSDPTAPTTQPHDTPTPTLDVPTDPTTPTVTEVPTATTTPTGEPTPTAVPTTPPDPGRIRIHVTLKLYNDVLAEHLDPEREHLVPYTRKTGNRQTSPDGDQLFALGSRYAWHDGQDSGLGLLQISVATGWDQVDWECGATYTSWACDADDTTHAEVAVHDGVRQVAVEHPSGQVVVLTADPTYDDGAGVSGLGVNDGELAEAAADERLVLPGLPAAAPPRLDEASFEVAGRAALVRKTETLDDPASDRTPMVRGDWTVDGVDHGQLTWSVDPTYSGAGWECSPHHLRCFDVDLGGRTVHVASVKKRWGGGWDVVYDGPVYTVQVHAADRGYPKKRAFAFVTADAWQPTAG